MGLRDMTWEDVQDKAQDFRKYREWELFRAELVLLKKEARVAEIEEQAIKEAAVHRSSLETAWKSNHPNS